MCTDPCLSFPVELSTQRGVVKHTWLENGIINKQVMGILYFRLDEKRWQALDMKFPALEEDAERFGLNFVDAFSTGKIVDHLSPLKLLPQEVREELRQFLDALYLQDGKMKQLQIEYQTHLTFLRDRLSELRDVWSLHGTNGIEQVQKSIVRLVDAALTLNAVMERIPKGAVIP